MKNKFFNLKVPAYCNKKNGQISIVIPRKKIRRFLKNKREFPKEVKISLWHQM